MSVQEFYESIGVNYTDVLRRLGSEKFIEKYLKKMLDDGNYDILRQAVEKGDFPEAFRASHTLKGICLNLGLSTLSESSSMLTEELRDDPDGKKVRELFAKVEDDYKNITDGIRNILL